MSINIRSNFSDLVLEDALPALEMIIAEEWAEFQSKYDKIFNVKTMSTSIAQSTQISSLKSAGVVAEGAQIPMQKVQQGFRKTYQALKYGILLGVSQEMLDDDPYDVMGDNPRRFSRAFNEAMEITAAAILNGGFSDTGPDGVSLFSASHPALQSGVADQSNLLSTAADLSVSSLKAMYTLLRKTRDSAGNRIQIAPKSLIVSPDDEFLAHEILKSVMLPNSDNAAVNSVNSISDRYQVEPIVWDYLTADDAFFVAGDKLDHKLCWYWRKKPELASDFEFKSDVALMKMTARWVAGYSDWRGIVASAGTA
jgi:hypothetical protein